jgi:P4 family phage/plasmid primase-like protien
MTSVLDRFYAHPLSKFLNDHKCGQGHGQDASLCGMGALKGRWLVKDEEYPQFIDHLHDYLFVQKGRPLNLVEQPRLDSPKPLLIDLDFKFAVDTNLSHRFNQGHIRSFVRNITESMAAFMDLSAYEALRFFVSLRPQAYADGKKYIKDGIHIQCPDIALTNEKQKVLRLWLLENESVQKAFADIGYTNTVEDIYDESMVRKQGWFPVGESKPQIPPYKLETVLTFNPDSGAIDNGSCDIEERELMEILSVRYNIPADDNDIRRDAKALYDKYLKAKPPPPSTAANLSAIPESIGVRCQETGHSYDTEETELAKAIALQCLSVKRADDYKTWMEVGWCLANIDGSESMFETFQEFSKKSDKSTGTDWGKLRSAWMRGFSRNTKGAKLTMKSLHYWAREDNAEKYKELIETDHIRFAQWRVADTHHHTARLLYRMYKGKYCASVESRKTEWYVYDDAIHTWRHTNQGMDLRDKLSAEVANVVVLARMRLKDAAHAKYMAEKEKDTARNLPGIVGTTSDSDWHKNWSGSDSEHFQILTKLEQHLYSTDFKNSVMKEAAELFCEEDFTNLLNMNQYLFACKNGVIDLNNEVYDADLGRMKKVVVFRPGKPDDYMSFLAGRNYPDSDAIEYHPYDPNDPMQQELMDFLAKIFPDPEMLSYYIRLMASCLEGANREQCYYTFIGVGGNGKSKVVDLMKYTFGDYCSSLSATALTRKRPDSGAANPDIIGIKNKRFIYLQEPDDREPLNTSRMKQFSGEDVVEARGLFEDQQRFRITGKLFMMCNRLPPIHAMDRGTWRRIRVLNFGSKFVDKSDPELKAERPNVFLRDNDLDAKLRIWREAWLSLLVHVYETEYLVSGLEPIPAAVINESNKYKESFDMYGKFKGERMVDMRDSLRLGLTEYGNEQATAKDVHVAYTNWVRQNEGIVSGKKLSKQEMQNRLDEDFGNLDGGVYKRVMVFFDDEGRAEFLAERAQA